jgi:phosphohistidine phosphatase
MELCLVRHAIAEERGPDWPDDSERPLTVRGHARMREAARGLATLFHPQLILTSPYVRARQTAEILEERYRTRQVRLCHALAPGDDAELLAELAASDVERVMAVGHEPHFSRTASLLLTGDGDGAALLFRKGAAALLSFEGEAAPGEGLLTWLLQPAALRALAS